MTIDLHPHDAFTEEVPELPDWMHGTRPEDFEPFRSVLREIAGHDLEETAPRGDD